MYETISGLQSNYIILMSQPIELGLVLEGQDALDFHEYCENPTISQYGLEAVREALRRIEEEDKRKGQ